jgi:hypothetical protein
MTRGNPAEEMHVAAPQKNGVVRRWSTWGPALAVLLCLAPAALAGDRLADIFRKDLAGLELEPLGPALADTVASSYPVASASSSVTYVYDPAHETFERRTSVLGPIIGERAETIGRGQFNVGNSYSYVRITSINGQDLDHLVNRPAIGGRFVSFPVPGGVILDDGRFTNVLPVQVKTGLDIEAQLVTPAVTYGITPDLDLNLSIPLVRTFLRVTTKEEVPDPRLPQFRLPAGDPNAATGGRSASQDAFGVGDILLRAKYVVARRRPLDFAASLGLSLPSGNEDDFQGTGETRVQPLFIASRVFHDRFEPLVNLGIDLRTDDVSQSVVNWAAGMTAQVAGPLSAAVVFLGRHELDEQTDPIRDPFFFQIERNDIYDASIGFRFLFAGTGVIAANVLVPLNDDGLRADVVPTVSIEYAFSLPW